MPMATDLLVTVVVTWYGGLERVKGFIDHVRGAGTKKVQNHCCQSNAIF